MMNNFKRTPKVSNENTPSKPSTPVKQYIPKPLHEFEERVDQAIMK